jgi:hypothetical protein
MRRFLKKTSHSGKKMERFLKKMPHSEKKLY